MGIVIRNKRWMMDAMFSSMRWCAAARLRWVCMLWLIVCGIAPVSAKTVTVVSGEWPGLTHADGSGLHFEIFRQAMALSNIHIKTRVSNWKRAKHMFAQQRVQVLLGDYKTASDDLIYPTWHLDYDTAIVLYSLKPLPRLSELAQQPVGWVLGYDFGVFLPVPVVPYEVATAAEGFSLLQHGRLAALISSDNNVPAALSSKLTRITLQPGKAMYPVFQNSFEGRLLARAYDEGMRQLYESGRLEALFHHAGNYQQAKFPPATPQ